jgi:amidohydrolase
MSGEGLREHARRLSEEIVAWRRDLHRNPELGFEEERTARSIASRLTEIGVGEVETGVAKTGVVAVLRAESGAGPAVLLRADMDALPIQEVAGREYGSQVPGKMHACGHDGHMAMLLGAAALLVERREALQRDVVFCFQPAEEGLGGARRMIEEGVLDRYEVGSAYALHLWSQFPSGTLHLRWGPIMAAQDEFTARIVGSGGHGAQPHRGRDPIVASALGIQALQSVVSRFVDPVEPAVVHVGSVHGGSAPNVIPEATTLEGSLRSFGQEVRETLRERVEATLRGAAEAAGCRLEFELRPGFPPVVNDPRAVERVRRVAAEVLGDDGVVDAPPMTASEDFAYFLRRVPGAFCFLGAGDPSRGITEPHHSPGFDIDESVLPSGAEILARVALVND